MFRESRGRMHLISAFLAAILSASAYPVYYNTVARTDLPVMTSFFWFSFFAVIGAFLYPHNLAGGATLDREVSLRRRFRSLYPDWPWRTWYRIVARSGGAGLIALSSAAGILYFVLLLSALKSHQTNVVLTVVVLQQANPLVFAIVGYYFLKDTCKSWTAYAIGAVMIAAGVVLYKYNLRQVEQVAVFDALTFLMIGVMICEAVMMVARTLYRRRHNVDALEAGRTSQLVSTIVAFLACLALGEPLSATPGQLLGLCYLGIVPTAISGILSNRAQDVVGVPWISATKALRPIYILGWSLLPLSIFAAGTEKMTTQRFLGILLACVGLAIVGLLAKPQPVKQG